MAKQMNADEIAGQLAGLVEKIKHDTRKEHRMRTYSLDKITDAANGSIDDIRPDGYSGRGMYGATCAAVTFGSMAEAFRFFTLLGALAANDDEDRDADPSHGATRAAFRLSESARTDSMGLDTVVYFPGWTFA